MTKLVIPLDHYPPAFRRRIARRPKHEQEEEMREAESWVHDPYLRKQVLNSKLFRLAREIDDKLHLGSGSEVNPSKIGQFLAWIASCDPKDLPWAVSLGLHWLGVDRITRKPGRPKGRKTPNKYLLFVSEAQQIIEERGLWVKKKQMRQQYRSDWQKKLRRDLKQDGWPDEIATWLSAARTPRSLAIYMVSGHLGVSYDAVVKGIQRASHPPKK
jgi:hypothetical protein